MAPDISKVDANGHLSLGTSAWNFSNEVMLRLLYGNSLSLPEDLLILFAGTYLLYGCTRKVFSQRFVKY